MSDGSTRRLSPAAVASVPPRPWRLALFAATLMLALWSLGVAADEGRPRPVTHTVTIDATSYRPKTLTVHAGDTIVWVNNDLLKHTATAKNGGFDSGDIPAGGSWKYTAKGDGLVAYGCTYHPTMKGTLRLR